MALIVTSFALAGSRVSPHRRHLRLRGGGLRAVRRLPGRRAAVADAAGYTAGGHPASASATRWACSSPATGQGLPPQRHRGHRRAPRARSTSGGCAIGARVIESAVVAKLLPLWDHSSRVGVFFIASPRRARLTGRASRGQARRDGADDAELPRFVGIDVALVPATRCATCGGHTRALSHGRLGPRARDQALAIQAVAPRASWARRWPGTPRPRSPGDLPRAVRLRAGRLVDRPRRRRRYPEDGVSCTEGHAELFPAAYDLAGMRQPPDFARHEGLQRPHRQGSARDVG